MVAGLESKYYCDDDDDAERRRDERSGGDVDTAAVAVVAETGE